ncbi:GNAT family N-acetyltransferase [Solirubrum puertoriconensis]|uniref:Cytochrome c domain-containing protein n=1 Tax=Solirubrum puertoriconensis TaxID=1751427 RepID=A0A9X0HLR4_SOLP1|nr:GNAT family N-acetyltransferase [Solirubrum puertoriconensis]KUG08129.1 hypothetical protein ASU33_08005 [Solirubrum puertoriconensis]
MIETPRLQLIPCTAAHFEAALAGHHVLAAVLGVAAAPNWPGSPEAVQALGAGYQHLRQQPALLGWWTYLVVHREAQQLIGLAGFKGRPDAEGNVEIGYSLMPEYRGQGLATEVAQALVAFAFEHPDVQRVQALTLPERNASCRVLEKAGLQFVGPALDPTEGEMWQWARPRATAASHGLRSALGVAAAGLLAVALGACTDNTSARAAEVAGQQASTEVAAPAEAAIADAGKTLFLQNCAICHGQNGKLGLNGAHDLTKSNLNQMGREYMVTNGLGKMPGFKGQLTPEQISQVAAYSLTLK